MRGAAVLAVAAMALPVTIFGQTPNDQQWSYPVIRKTAAAIERLHQRAPYAVGVGFFDYVPLVVGQGLILQLNSDGVRVGANNGFEDSLGGHYRLGPELLRGQRRPPDPPETDAGDPRRTHQPGSSGDREGLPRSCR